MRIVLKPGVLMSTVAVVCAALLIGCSRNGKTEFSDPPSWASAAQWYQIFPDRFRNGDITNDPRPIDLEGSWPHSVPAGWRTSAWTGDWYERQAWEKGPSEFNHCAGTRRYGGDLQGVIERLDYLQDLGVNALYLNPLFESPSLHKYDATLYHHIDNNFGPDPDGDRAIWETEDPADPTTWQWTSADSLFLQFLREAHSRNIRVVIDGVFNHCGMTFWAFKDVRKNGPASAYRDWYTVTSFDDPATEEDEFACECWYGVRELPEFREDENGLVTGPREHVKAIVKRWMDPDGNGDPQDGIDGWRLDVADKVHLNFWRQLRRWVREINPEAYLVGEVWWEDWANEKMYNAAPWLQGDVFDAVMNYRWARDSFRFFAGGSSSISASEFAVRLQRLLVEYPSRNNAVLMNLYDSHDTDRLLSHVVNAGHPYDKEVGAGSPGYDVRKPNAGELAIARLMALFQMTYLGAPMVYYGTEVGMWGADDPDCRKPMLWPELTYKKERSHPLGWSRSSDENTPDTAMFSWYRRLRALRRAHPALQSGTADFLPAEATEDVIAYSRTLPLEKLWILLNRGETQVTYSLDLRSEMTEGTVTDLVTGNDFAVEGGGCIVGIGAKEGVVLKVRR